MNSSMLIFWHVDLSFERVEVGLFTCILMMLKYVFFFTTKYCQSIPQTVVHSIGKLQLLTVEYRFQYQHSRSTCIWRSYYSYDRIFQSLWFLSYCFW